MTERGTRRRGDRVARRIAEEAAHWYLDQREGLDADAQQAFLAWLQCAPAHREEYLAIARLHGDLKAVAAQETASAAQLRAGLTGERAVVMLPARGAAQRARRQPRRRLRWLATAAVVLAVGVVALGSWFERAPAGAVFAADDGQPRQLALPDGTVVQLDRGSAIAVRFDARRRDIALLRGRALFDVGKDPLRPLEVRLGAGVLRDIGTVFEASRGAQGGEVTVLSGRVHVLAPAHPWLAGWARRLGHPLEPARLAADLGAGEQARIDGAGQVIGASGPADVQQATRWLPAEIAFHDAPVADVARRFNAYTTTPLVVEDARIGALRISGRFHARDPAAFVAYLGSLPGVRIARDHGRVRVLAATTHGARRL